ncbi:Na+/H+ antiporter [Chitinophaga lutea]
MLEKFGLYVFLVLVILALVMIARKLKVAYPIVLVLGGLALSLIPGMPAVAIDPELIFIIFLPPLLYEAAWYTSWKEFWRWRRIIISFAFLIVLVTSFAVAVTSAALIPGFTLALGFLLGGIVSPPDAVSATSVLKGIAVPKRVTSILEGESLFNDASSLIIFQFAFIAVNTGEFVLRDAAWQFVVMVVMGIVTGVAIGLAYYWLHRWLPTSANIDIVLTLTAPYVMYIAAEHFHFSGVLSVVSGGLFLSARSQRFLSYRSRLHGANVWSTLGFVLNGLVFMLIGLELPVIVSGLGDVSLGMAIAYGLLIALALIVCRLLCTFGASVFTVFISRFITTADNRPGWKGPVIIGWAGMRGVVSLAAALSIPIYLDSGDAFPQRNLILFITFTVILVTLVIQGLTLPWVVKRVNMEDPDAGKPVEEEEADLRSRLASRCLEYLHAEHKTVLQSNGMLRQLCDKLEKEGAGIDGEAGLEQAEFRRVYLLMLDQQRSFLHGLKAENGPDEELIRKYESLADLEEEKIRMRYGGEME